MRYSRASMARTLMARLPCLTRTRSWALWSHIHYTFVVNFLHLCFSCCYFHFLFYSDRRSLIIENENNNRRSPIYKTRVTKHSEYTYVETYIGWLLPLTGTIEVVLYICFEHWIKFCSLGCIGTCLCFPSEVIKRVSCSAQLSRKNSILRLCEPENAEFLNIVILMTI